MTDLTSGIVICLIVIVSILAAAYDRTHTPHGYPGVYMPGPHGSALPGM